MKNFNHFANCVIRDYCGLFSFIQFLLKGDIEMFDLFCFASKNVENIWTGVRNNLWAVATLMNQSSMLARTTKAVKYLNIGAYGLLYCNPRHAFTTPFIVRSRVDENAVVDNVWPESWVLPFKIEPLGDPSKLIPADEARERWPVVKRNWKARGGISAAMNITGTTVFVPVQITEQDWTIICHDLARSC